MAAQADSLFEYVLINYRWIFVIFFLLPLSLLFEIFNCTRNWIVFKLSSAPKQHEKKVRNIQRQIKEWRNSGANQQMCTARPGWQTMSFRQARYKSSMFNVNINMVDVLEVNVEKQYVRVEPMVTMGQLSATLAPLGWTIPVLPEIDDLTVGGLVMGTGIESSSHKFGLFQHICRNFEIALCDGSIINCSKDNDPDLFYSIPWSHGTLGFLLSVNLDIIPAEKYIKLEYEPVTSLKDACEVFKRQTYKKDNNQFIEGLMFSKDKGVIMTGNMTSQVEEHLVNPIGRWYKPWFFTHVESKFRNGSKVEYIPLRDYYHRHTKSLFWELNDIIPFGNNPLFRYLLGWMMPPKVALLKLTQTAATKKLYEQNHIIQDMLVPIERLEESILKFHNAVRVYPLWLCPFKLTPEPGLVNSRTSKDEMYVDIGVYGVPKISNFKAVESTRDIEEFVRNVKGYQMLYADTYTTREEFREMFNHSLYDKVRERFQCNRAFPEVYDKVNKNARI
ncbi:delta(24)-sterol reductase isoform X2 [Cephus cinctus]|nr:delta(24)-sterol reductase isoform X2 [Cephus cinctus]XP_024946737.1 delta(24)-sterol reductase isoform X2 [Cephus cinctus]XP_024946738.1 delta(24)-sterol reductase isoform X2 [Cephus cinctus]XP_024946739.1 delta(24)-sterol reductase isoform X2 [Cephus cinctus]XP_024946740.1 delta(24)-sterol reductase isoform X2 [Cephus cinctus]